MRAGTAKGRGGQGDREREEQRKAIALLLGKFYLKLFQSLPKIINCLFIFLF